MAVAKLVELQPMIAAARLLALGVAASVAMESAKSAIDASGASVSDGVLAHEEEPGGGKMSADGGAKVSDPSPHGNSVCIVYIDIPVSAQAFAVAAAASARSHGYQSMG